MLVVYGSVRLGMHWSKISGLSTFPFISILVSVSDLLKKYFYGINVNTAPANYTGHPALSLPVGSSEGLPVGGMLVGRRGADDKLLQVAFALEQQLREKPESQWAAMLHHAITAMLDKMSGMSH